MPTQLTTAAPQRIARFCIAYHQWVVLAWLLLFALCGAAGWLLLDGALTTQTLLLNKPESTRARHLITDGSLTTNSYTDALVVSHATLDVDDPVFRARVLSLAIAVRKVQGVEGATSYYETGGQAGGAAGGAALVGKDRRTTLIPFALPENQKARANDTLALVRKFDGQGGFRLHQTGQATLDNDLNEQSKRDLIYGETIGLAAALLVLLLVFGSVVASVVPVVFALTSIAIALGVVAVIGQWFTFSFFVINLLTMMGLAVGIDYCLFVISRYREERARGCDTNSAIEIAGRTSGKSVLFAGMTVVVSMAGLLLVPNSIFISLAAGAIIVVLVTVLQVLTLLPAVLSLLGDRLEWGRLPWLGTVSGAREVEGGFFAMMARVVISRPKTGLMLATVGLLVAAVPMFNINVAFTGVSSLPDGLASKEGYRVLEAQFDAGSASPVQIVIDHDPYSDEVAQTIERLTFALRNEPAFGEPKPMLVSDDDSVALVEVPLAYDPQSLDAYAAVQRMRQDILPAVSRAAAGAGADVRLLVGGRSADDLDFIAQMRTYTMPVIALVLLLSVVLLTVAFRSVMIAITSTLVTLLSVLAAYGILVLVFQYRVGAELLGFPSAEAIEPWLPLVLFALLFGLSMDYQVILVSRIQEHWRETGDTDEAVLWGVATTSRLITGAAAIMVAVFAGLALGELSALAEMGFGLAVAVTLDAVVVRGVLVPAAMKLLGDWNWYFPSWLEWLPDLRIEREPTAELLTVPPSVPPDR